MPWIKTAARRRDQPAAAPRRHAGGTPPVQVGQLDIEQHDIGGESRHLLQRRHPARRRLADDLEPLRLEQGARGITEPGMVIDDQDGRPHRASWSQTPSAGASWTATVLHVDPASLSPPGTPSPAARAQAIAALVGIRADGSVDLALAALRDPDWGMRMIVASEIESTGDPRVVDALLDLLNDADGYVREAAAIGLDRQGDPRALEPLRAMPREYPWQPSWR